MEACCQGRGQGDIGPGGAGGRVRVQQAPPHEVLLHEEAQAPAKKTKARTKNHGRGGCERNTNREEIMHGNKIDDA
jgi:hypothetical protein